MKETKESVMINLARFIKAERTAKGISGTKLAHASGRSKNYITRLEGRKLEGIPKVETLKAIAKALQIEPEILLAKAGYSINKIDIPTVDNVILRTANEHGLSNKLANSLTDIVNTVLNSQKQEEVARTWFRNVLSNYVYIKAQKALSEGLGIKQYQDLANEILEYANNYEFSIENIELKNYIPPEKAGD